MADAAENLPDGTDPTDPVGSFPHIPWYAIGCTLDSIAAESDGRMTVEVIGQSALGRDLYLVTINALDTPQQRRDYEVWQQIRKVALDDPAHARAILSAAGDRVKIPVFIQGAIHGNEYEGVDADMQLIERLATTPYGADPEVDGVLDHAVVLFNVVQNPDGRIAGTRANGNGFDLNRDFLTQSQPETKASVSIMQKWLPPDMLDQHGYVTPTLIEATTKPHNPGIDYDLWLEWNQPRTLANKEALAAVGLDAQRPVNEWCPDAERPGPSGLCDGGVPPGPAVAEGWDDWGPFYTPMYNQLVGLNGSTVEMCSSTTSCGGRAGARRIQYVVAWSTLIFDIPRRHDLLMDELEIYRRGVADAPRPACCPPPFDVANNWMTEYPQAYVIPLGPGQRSDAEANRLVEWLLVNGIEVSELKRNASVGAQKFAKGSYVVWMDQAKRGLAETALSIGVDISAQIGQLYAPPGAWSHGYLWGADVVTVPDGASFPALSERIFKPNALGGGVDSATAGRYALELDSATAVRTLNELLGSGVPAELATAPAPTVAGGSVAAGSALFAGDEATRIALDAVGRKRGVIFQGVAAESLPPLEPIDRVPRIAVLTGAVNQDIWSLRNLGFSADPVSTTVLNTAPEDPLARYDVIFNTGGYPSAASTTARARLTQFFAAGGGYIGAGANGGNFLASGLQVTGFGAATRGGLGRSGIVYWVNATGEGSPIVGAYPDQDTAIMDPPTWFTSVPDTMTVDGRLPLTGFFASGLWAPDDQSASAPGAAVIAHGTNTAGTARMTLFAMNPLYRADPEREWPMVSGAAYWADQ